MDEMILDEFDPSKGRQIRKGHSLEPVTYRGARRIVCSCGWFIQIMPGLMDLEMAEELAWLHVSKPQLLIKGSSDLLLPGRIARLDSSSEVD